MSPRQTASFLMQRFREVGLEPNSKHGQNFLIDLNLVELLADTADVTPQDVVLEIGTGTGSLTALFAPYAAAVITVEIDAHLYQMASEILIDFPNVTMLHQDALKNKNKFHPNVIEAVQNAVNAEPGLRLKLAANLPYNIATPIIANLLLIDPVPFSMTVTIQKELAYRILAKPRTKDYSALSVWMQALCDCAIIREMAPTVFWPRPKVDSAILQIFPNAEKRNRIPDLMYFHAFVRAMFFHRRKFLRNELIAAYKDQLDKPAIDALMEKQNLGPKTRAEELEVETLMALCEAARELAPTLQL